MSDSRVEQDRTGARYARWPYLLAAVFLTLDQLTKRWVVDNFALYEERSVLPGFFNLIHARNTGAAFGLFQGYPQALALFSIVVFCAMVIFRGTLFGPSRWEQGAFGLLVAGIIGNMIDRMKFGYVVDFLDVYLGDNHWPAFNVADSCICVAVGILLLAQWREAALEKAGGKAA